MSANGFEFVKVMVSVDATFTVTLAGANASETVGADGLTEISAGQALLPAVLGALETALVGSTVTVAVSAPPWESVTVRIKVPVPVVVTFALLAPERMVTPPLAVHA